MAMLVPLLPVLLSTTGTAAATAGSVGLMGSVLTGVSLLTTVAGGISEYRAGQDAEEIAELNARTEELNARREALSINEELFVTLSRNTVAAAAGGLTSSGSVARAQEDTKASAAEELSINRINSAQAAQDLRLKGKQAATAGKHALAGSLFDVVSRSASTHKKIKGT